MGAVASAASVATSGCVSDNSGVVSVVTGSDDDAMGSAGSTTDSTTTASTTTASTTTASMSSHLTSTFASGVATFSISDPGDSSNASSPFQSTVLSSDVAASRGVASCANAAVVSTTCRSAIALYRLVSRGIGWEFKLLGFV